MKKAADVDAIFKEAESYVESFPELVASLRKEARDHERLTDLKQPVAYLSGDVHRLRAGTLRNIADRVDRSWKKVYKASYDKKMYDTLVSIKKSFENKLFGKRGSYIDDEGIWKMVSKTLEERP